MSLRFCKIHPQMSYMFFATVAKKKKRTESMYMDPTEILSSVCVCVTDRGRDVINVMTEAME